MNRRGFLRAALASTATIVVAPACVLDELAVLAPSNRTYVDMGKHAVPPEYPTPGDFYDAFDLSYIMPLLASGAFYGAAVRYAASLR